MWYPRIRLAERESHVLACSCQNIGEVKPMRREATSADRRDSGVGTEVMVLCMFRWSVYRCKDDWKIIERARAGLGEGHYRHHDI